MHLARPPTAARPGTNVSRPRRAPRVCSAADKTICGPSGSGGAGGGAIDGPGPAIDGTIALDAPSSKGGAIDLASGGGAGGFGIDSGNAGAGGISGTGGFAAASATLNDHHARMRRGHDLELARVDQRRDLGQVWVQALRVLGGRAQHPATGGRTHGSSSTAPKLAHGRIRASPA